MAQATPSCLAIIPARGGSKGVPRKNVTLLAGRPLIAWTIGAAREAKRVTRVVVSTDDAEIARVAGECGAGVVWRPAEISDDSASSESALLHVLGHLRETENYRPELLAFLQCTSPLTTAADIDGTIGAMLDQRADCALSAARFFHFVWRVDSDGACGVNHDKRVRQRRQERPPEFLENGAVYAMRTDGFLAARHRFFGKTAIYEVAAGRALEIDEPGDFEVAEVLLRRREESQRRSLLPSPVAAVVFDFDGVFTDDLVLVDESGREAVTCSRSDGHGLAALAKSGVPMLVISKEANPVVGARCAKLGIKCVQGCNDKLPVMSQWLKQGGINAANTVYVGNDVNDLECLAAVGCGVAVADAHVEVRAAARMVLSRPGGHGAVRESCDLIMKGMSR
jgi:YrbI family 3-deoxy-D-manno-octulosonate 8-phosphate phosphatase